MNPKVITPVLAVLAVAWSSSLWSIGPARTFNASLILSASVLTWLVLAMAVSDKPQAALVALVVGTTIMSAKVLSADVNIDGRAETAANANDIAVLLAASGAFLLGRVLSRDVSPKMRLVSLGLAGIHVAALVDTGSRSGVLALGAALTLVIAVNLLRLRLGVPIGLALAVGLIVIGVWALNVAIPQRVLHIQAALGAGDLNGREYLWAAALSEQPSVIGVGFGAAPDYLMSAIGMDAVVHSVYLGLALEVGVIGLLVWGWMAMRLVSGARFSFLSREFFMMTTVVAVMAMTLTLETRRPLWVFLALVASLSIRRVDAPVAEKMRR